MQTTVINTLVYFQKPAIGFNAETSKQPAPLQVVFPNGGFGLGLPLKEGQTAQVILTKKNKQNSIV
jgi:hypothetical protein